ncbi:hypothetical protein L596_004384 [Steinernema carpocapsae]|uniref:Elongation of very long chain fatty acids protein n=1 Tax=Steinernema carpocapsae TaxID=34508 RepID=A0A4U8UX58_STECR|nr:hypothetical protein L596_004384 [Steinernema carpocapsae]
MAHGVTAMEIACGVTAESHNGFTSSAYHANVFFDGRFLIQAARRGASRWHVRVNVTQFGGFCAANSLILNASFFRYTMGLLELLTTGYEFEAAKKWCAGMEYPLIMISFAYVVTIWSIKFFMADRKPFDLQRPLNIWNAGLAIFSIFGFIRLTPTFLGEILNKGIQSTYTTIGPLQEDNVAGYWTFLWVFSKIPELVDTIFIVLRKKPLMFMHWYHHALTGYFSFVNYSTNNAYMIWVVWINYFIHSFMYSYYMLRSFRFRVPPQVAQLITGAQIVQFLITHAVMAHLAILVLTHPGNDFAVTFKGFFIGAFMEITYLMLWFQFYHKSYIANGGKKYNDHQAAVKGKKQ